MNGMRIQQTDSIKYLGVIIDKNFRGNRKLVVSVGNFLKPVA